jgi:hypothetical protein
MRWIRPTCQHDLSRSAVPPDNSHVNTAARCPVEVVPQNLAWGRAGDRRPVDSDDHVAGLDSSFRSRGALVYPTHNKNAALVGLMIVIKFARR